MADKPIPRRTSGSPGVGGAFRDALKAIQDYAVGVPSREIADAKRQRIDAAVDGDNQRMRDGQSTDSNNY